MDIDLSVPIWTIEHVAAALHLSVCTDRGLALCSDVAIVGGGAARPTPAS